MCVSESHYVKEIPPPTYACTRKEIKKEKEGKKKETFSFLLQMGHNTRGIG